MFKSALEYLSMVFYTLILVLFKKWSKEKRKRTEEKQNSATKMTSAEGKGIVFPLKLKLQEE